MQPALCLLQRRIMRKRAETVRDATLISTLAVVLTFGSSQVAVGQTCLRGQPEPGCAGFIVLEFTGAIRLNEKAGATDQNAAFVYWSGGYLQNLDREICPWGRLSRSPPTATAIGTGQCYGIVAGSTRPSASSLAPGLFVGGKDNFMTLKFPSPTADLAFNYGDRIGLALGVDGLRQAEGGTQWQGQAGVRFGTWLAPVATLGLGVLMAATW